MIRKLLLISSALYLSLSAFAQEDLKIMYYNILKFPDFSDRADTLKNIIQHVQPDVFIVNELKTTYGANLIMTRALNVDGVTHYAQATFQNANGTDTDNHLYYNSNKIGLSYQRNINASPRAISEYKIYYKDPNLAQTNDTTFLYLYACHLKAGNSGNSTPTEEQQRATAATALKNYLTSNSRTTNVIVGGDFNMYTSSEDAFTNITTGGTLNLYDPITQSGAWNNNYNYRNVHTQSTRAFGVSNPYAGGSTGGMDDRFDIIFVSNDILNGSQGAKYVTNSYEAVGQDGEHYNSSVNDGYNYSVPQDVATSLFYMSDHLPVLLEVTVGGPVSIQQHEDLIADLNFDSNNKELNIYFEKEFNELNLSVYALSGKQVLNKQFNNSNSISEYLLNLTSGMYIVNMLVDGEPVSAKIMVY